MKQKLKKVSSPTVGGVLEILPCWTQSTMYIVSTADPRNVFALSPEVFVCRLGNPDFPGYQRDAIMAKNKKGYDYSWW